MSRRRKNLDEHGGLGAHRESWSHALQRCRGLGDGEDRSVDFLVRRRSHEEEAQQRDHVTEQGVHIDEQTGDGCKVVGGDSAKECVWLLCKERTKHKSFLKRAFEKSDTMETESLEIKQAGPDFAVMVDLYLRVGVRNLFAFQS